jgi:hypothetical protein
MLPDATYIPGENNSIRLAQWINEVFSDVVASVQESARSRLAPQDRVSQWSYTYLVIPIA